MVYPNKISIKDSGASGLPITYKGTGWGNGKAILDIPLTKYDDPAETVAFGISSNYITIDGFEIKGRKSAAIMNTGSNNIIKNNVIHTLGAQTIPRGAGNNGYGMYLVGSNNILIENNDIYDTNYTAITMNGGSDITIKNNHLHDGYVDGIGGGTNGGYLIIDGNTINGFSNTVSHGDGMQILKFPGTLIISNNVLHNNTQQIFS